MAKVSHLPMRRYPSTTTTGTSTDQQNQQQSQGSTNVDTINFYPPANASQQQRDKSKRTWGQRLKLTKSTTERSGSITSGSSPFKPPSSSSSSSTSPSVTLEVLDYSSLQQQHHAQLQHLQQRSNGPSLLNSAAAGSMKYAETTTWMYGTMRGMPAGMSPMHHHQLHPGLLHPAMFCPMPPGPPQAEVAVVICCCPEYLNGTKRDVKKASVCKRCKGSRLPLAPIGGTMRLTSGTTFLAPPARSSAGTMKLASTYGKKNRPTILGSSGDPYDFMRRSRLSQPEQAKQSVKSSIKEKLRGRAKSSSPSKGRSRVDKRPPSPTGSKSSGSRSLSASRSSSSNKGFKDCWVEPDEVQIDPDPGSTAGGRRSILRCDINPYDLISLSSGLNNEFSPTAANGTDDYDLSVHSQKYENLLDTLYANRYNPAATANIAAISGQRIKLFDGESAAPSVYDDVDEYVYDPVEVQPDTGNLQEPSRIEVIPERPPRTKHKHDSSSATPRDEDVKSLPSQISSEVTQSAIKSILKRPGSSVISAPTGDKPSFDTIRLNQTLVQRLNKLTSDEGVFAKSTGTVSARNIKALSYNGTNSSSSNKDRDSSKRNSGTQFYLPSPLNGPSSLTARKKVHFLVEHNEVIDDDKFFAQLLLSEANARSLVKPAEPPTVTIVEVTDDDSNAKQSSNESVITTLVNHLERQRGLVKEQQPSSLEKVQIQEEVPKVAAVATDVNEDKENAANEQDDDADNFSPWSIRRRSGPPVRRSSSERSSPPRVTSFNGQQPSSTQHHHPTPRFIDTMALRGKQARRDSRAVFDEETSSSSSSSCGTLLGGGKMRPRVPPPPPPPPASSTGSSSPDQQSITSASTVEGGEVGCKKYENEMMAGKLNDPEESNIYEDFCFDLSSGSERSSGRSSTASRTVVQVASTPTATFSKEIAAVHRLEIRHEDEDSSYESMGQKKTSIMITGDDCYSTVNVDDDNETPLYQSSVVVNDDVVCSPGIHQTSFNTVTISVNSPTSTLQHPRHKADSTPNFDEQKNNFLNSATSIIPIGGTTSVTVTTPTAEPETQAAAVPKSPSTGKTFISLDFDRVTASLHESSTATTPETSVDEEPEASVDEDDAPISIVPSGDEHVEAVKQSKDESVDVILRNPVEAVKRNLVPHICGKLAAARAEASTDAVVVRRPKLDKDISKRNSFIAKLLEDPMLGHLAEGLDYELVAKLIENSLMRLKESRTQLDMSGTKDEDAVSRMIEESLVKIQEERQKLEGKKGGEKDSNRSSISSGNSYGSAAYELMEFDASGELSDCYQSCSSDLTVDEEQNANSSRSKFYQMLVDATLSEIEISTANDDDHHYESIRLNADPIYEEISDIPPPLPLTAPPIVDDLDREKRNARSIFEGASKYDILSYLVDAKERGIAQEEAYNFQFGNASDIILEEEEDENITDLRHHQRQISDISSRLSHISNISDSSEDTSSLIAQRKASEIERNDSGVGSETSKTSRSKWQNPSATSSLLDKISPIHLCEDCDGPVETQITESGVMYAPLVCRKCGKKRAERKEIITEIVETEEKYGRDLQIILEEFYQPMLVAGLLSQDQLSAIFLNVEELLENNQFLAERMRDALDIANEQGDEDLLTVSAGRIFLEAAPMLHAFESYCVRQGAASLLLANLEKEKELLRIFLRVSQMENAVLRRMNLNSFLMVPVQRVTKYPLLLARLFKVTPAHLEGRELLKQAQEKIELHLNHMNREAKDVPTKLWRRISSGSPAGRRLSCELDMINIKLRKMAIDVLEWNTEEVRFAIEGRLLFTQPNDGNWKKSRTIKLTSINALLVTNGKPSPSYKPDRASTELLNFPRHTGIREASLLLVREKNGRYTLLREPLYLDRCIVCTENDWEDYFELQEILSKESFIFKAEDGTKTKQWYSQLQYHSQGMGTWRKRRNALANIMINGMMTRT